MEQKCYRLQYKSPAKQWKDSVDYDYPYSEDGLNAVVKDYRLRVQMFAKDTIKFRVICVTTEVLDIPV